VKKKRTGILGLLILLFAILLLAILWFSSHEEQAKTEAMVQDPLESITADREAGAFKRAYDTAVEAMANDPTNFVFAVEAGELSLIMRKPELAGEYMRTAWELGARQLPILLVIIDTMDAPSAEKVALFDARFPELPQTPANLNAKARFYSRFGRHDKALDLWMELCEAEPSEGLILQIARKLEMTGRRDEALALLHKHAQADRLTTEGYNLLFSLLVFNNQFEDAEIMANSLAINDPYGEWDLKKAMLLLAMGRMPETAQKLTSLIAARTDHPFSYAVAHEARVRLALLRTILEGPQAQFDDLQRLAKEEARAFPRRTVITPLTGLRTNPKQIEGERILYAYLDAAARGLRPPNTQFARLATLLPNSPVTTWLGIRQALSDGRASDAVAYYTALSSMHPLERIEGTAGLFYKSPLFIFEVARAYAANGHPNKALALINHLHDRGIYTPASLRMFSGLMEETGNDKNLPEMQRALQQQFKDDPTMQLAGASLALDLGEDNRALDILAPLLDREPDNTSVRMAELMLMLNNGQTDQVLERCATSTISPKDKSLIQARAWLLKGNKQKAESYFKEALDAHDDFHGYLDYARFLVIEKRTVAATKLYEEILREQPDNLVALQGMAIIDELNEKPEQAAFRLKKLLRAHPTDLYARIRLAKVFLQIGRTREALDICNKVLVRDPKSQDARFLQIMALTQMAIGQTIPALRQRELTEVNQKITTLLATNPDNRELLGAALTIKLAMGDNSGARATAKQLLALTGTTPPVQLQQLYISLLISDNKLDQARAQLTAAGTNIPLNIKSVLQSRIFAKEAKAADALVALRATGSDSPAVLAEEARLCIVTEDADTARNIIARGLFNASQLSALGGTAAINHAYELALYCFDEALAKEPDNPTLLNNAAWAGLRAPAGDTALALTRAQRASRHEPENRDFADTYIDALYRQKSYAKLIDAMKTIAPPRRTLLMWIHLAEAYQTQAQPDKAIATYQVALEMPTGTWREAGIDREAIEQTVAEALNEQP